MGAGVYGSFEEAFSGLKILKTEEPDAKALAEYSEAYDNWEAILNKQISD